MGARGWGEILPAVPGGGIPVATVAAPPLLWNAGGIGVPRRGRVAVIRKDQGEVFWLLRGNVEEAAIGSRRGTCLR